MGWVVLKSILPLSRNHIPYPTSQVLHIPGIPGNDVDVDVKYGLSSSGACIESDIESIRVEVFFKVCFGLFWQFPEIVVMECRSLSFIPLFRVVGVLDWVGLKYWPKLLKMRLMDAVNEFIEFLNRFLDCFWNACFSDSDCYFWGYYKTKRL